ncbi:MAG TPA: AAA family ATPase [Roseiarcus sp.]|nr:AAA family ATPase [Roseiarcus sp.]
MSGDGIALRCKLPDDDFEAAWASIRVPSGVKERLLSQALLSLTVRQKLPFETAPLHGLVLMVGEPGTGKTTLARGLAHQVARRILRTKTTFLQIDPHALAGAALSSSQKAVTKLFEQTLPEAAMGGIAVVLLDELETLAPARHRLSFEANPVDVHRATDAVLTGMDNLTREHKNVLIIGTSNFPKALDPAVISRADLIEDIGLPNEEARRDIVIDTLRGIAQVWHAVGRLEDDAGKIAKVAAGLDGRAIRKAIFAGAAADVETAQNLDRLTRTQIEAALRQALEARQKAAGG